jgi:SAM-dependent methyltransferase
MVNDPVRIGDEHYFGVFAALAGCADAAHVRRCSPYDDPFAEVYDVDEQGTGGDLEFFRAAAERHGGPVLDLACGSGRISAALADAGFEVDGVDRSAAMLARAGRRLEGRQRSGEARLRLGDAFAAPAVGRYGLIVLGATMFGAFLQHAGAAWLSGLRAALRPGGALCFDVGWPATGSDGDLRVRVSEGDSGTMTVLQGFARLPDGSGHVFNAYAERDLGARGRRHLASETILTPSAEAVEGDLTRAGWRLAARTPLAGADGYVASVA